MLNERLANVIIGVVTVVWAVNFGAGLVVPGYKPDQTVHAVFMAIVGGTFALKGRNGGGPPSVGKGDRSAARGDGVDHADR